MWSPTGSRSYWTRATVSFPSLLLRDRAAGLVENVSAECPQAGLGREAEMGQAEVVLDRAQQAVVVVVIGGYGARPDAGREHDRADPAATGSRNRSPGIHRVRSRLLAAASACVGIAGLGV